MRLPLIQCDDIASGVPCFVPPEAITSIHATTCNEKGCYLVSFYGGVNMGKLGEKTIPNVKSEPELRDWLDFHVRGLRHSIPVSPSYRGVKEYA